MFSYLLTSPAQDQRIEAAGRLNETRTCGRMQTDHGSARRVARDDATFLHESLAGKQSDNDSKVDDFVGSYLDYSRPAV